MSYIQSVLFAFHGIIHALKTEKNLKLFTVMYLASLIAAWILGLEESEWPFVVFAGGMFLCVELVNTALERLSDAFDDHSTKQADHYYDSIKATKDIAAGASLVCAVVWLVVLALVFCPHIRSLLS